MKKINLKVAACLMAGATMYSSCYVGSYGLFNSYAKWQTHMTSSKFVNAIVGFIIGPIAGGVSLLIDTLVLNTIEFWSGSNPMQANIGKTQQVLGSDGRYYAVTTTKNGYEVKAPNGEMKLLHLRQEEQLMVADAERRDTRAVPLQPGRHHHHRTA